MALADIQQHIRDKASKEAAEMEKRTEAELQDMTKAWEEKLATEKERLVQEAKRSAEAKLAQIKFKIREKVNTEELAAKQEAIDAVYTDVQEKLSKLSDADYSSLLEKLLVPVKRLDGTLVTSKDKVDVLKKAARHAGCKAHVADEHINTIGGFIFRSKTADLDSTFETLLERVREDTLIEVNNKLFGSEA